MKTKQKKQSPEDDLDVLDIKLELERIPVENIAEVTETLDRVRISAQKLVSRIAEATEKVESGELGRVHFEDIVVSSGKALTMLNQGMRIVLNAAAAKEKLNSGK